MPDARPDVAPLPESVSERYRIVSAIGSGALSTVYQAEDRLLQRTVAIKVFTTSAETPLDLQRQEAEAKLIASLNHYALTTLFDAGATTGPTGAARLYLVMEFIPGRDLKERLRTVGVLPWLQVCWLGHDLAEGLEYLHGTGYLHRDIKPANVLLADRDLETRMRGKLSDFGISSLLGTPAEGDSVTGTAAYLSPEQVEGREATEASDVYSLGLVLLEALTGRMEYPGDAVDSAMARLDRQPSIPESVPAPVADLLRAMTALDEHDRPAPHEVAARFHGVVIDRIVADRAAPVTDIERERERLRALQRYSVLNAPPQETFDRVTRLATQLLGVPSSAVSIVDVDRVWLTSRRGVEAEYLNREVAICADEERVEPWSVDDVRLDPRTADLPFVVGPPHIRAYAAAPLVTRDGHILGSVCVFEDRVRIFTDTELGMLADLAAIVMNDLEMRLSSRRVIFNR